MSKLLLGQKDNRLHGHPKSSRILMGKKSHDEGIFL